MGLRLVWAASDGHPPQRGRYPVRPDPRSPIPAMHWLVSGPAPTYRLRSGHAGATLRTAVTPLSRIPFGRCREQGWPRPVGAGLYLSRYWPEFVLLEFGRAEDRS